MSLTEFVSEAPVRDDISNTYPNQGERATEPLSADWQTNNYTLVGTAFDYLLRFWLEHHAETLQTRPWVAEDGLQAAETVCPEYVPEIKETITQVQELRDEFLETGQLTRPLIEGAIDLARIDSIYRGGVPPNGLGKYAEGDIVDCLCLVNIISDMDEFNTITTATLNPTFGLASELVAGADADAILDGTLLDVKATSKATFKIDYWRQLIGYLVLADVHEMMNECGVYAQLGYNPPVLPDIDSFGVYYARHGELSTVPASIVYENEKYPEFRSRFVTMALDKYRPFERTIESDLRNIF